VGINVAGRRVSIEIDEMEKRIAMRPNSAANSLQAAFWKT
jgi:hypothetical protein